MLDFDFDLFLLVKVDVLILCCLMYLLCMVKKVLLFLKKIYLLCVVKKSCNCF